MSEAERIECICGRSCLPKNWPNHLLGAVRGPHARLEAPVNGMTVEETRLLQRLDLLEADPERMSTLAGKQLHTQLSNRLTLLATRGEDT